MERQFLFLKKALPPTLLCLWTLLTYWPTLNNSFVYDDHILLNSVRHEPGKSKNLEGLEKDFYRPLLLASFTVERSLWGNNPKYFHVLNLLLHVANAVLLLTLIPVLKITPSPWAGFWGALIFALHPVQVEPVAWISQRAALASLFFTLCFLHMYLSWKKKISTVLILLLTYSLGLLFKETTAALILLLPCVDRFVMKRWKSFHRDRFRRSVYVGLFAVTGLYLILRISHTGTMAERHLWGDSWLSHLGNVGWASLHHIRLLAWPLNLRASYSDLSVYESTAPLMLILGWVALLAIGTALIVSWKKPPLGFCLSWIVFAFLPSSSLIFPVMTLVAERFWYIPMAGIAFLTASLSQNLRSTALKISFSIPLLLLSAQSFQTCRVWKNDETLWKNTAEKAPGNWFSRAALSEVYLRRQDWQKSEEMALEALKLQPSIGVAVAVLTNLAFVYDQKNQPEKAAAAAEKALQSDPDRGMAYAQLAVACARLGQWKKYKQAIETLNRTPAEDSEGRRALRWVEFRLKALGIKSKA
ncbi:MAG: hypothetical protein HY400_04210 [Elusimicrobia bacterium]|nr:hypothetical protein [Elusimicrobiota bacterium]